jgi:outer membrane immunogenic protein
MDGFVLGAEVDASYIDLEAKGTAGGFHEDFMATARLRAGATLDRYLFYITGGVAGTDKSARMANLFSDSEFVLGFTGGAGIEAMCGDNWSARIEYLYVNVPDDNLNSGGVTIVGGSDNHIVRAGLNWNF